MTKRRWLKSAINEAKKSDVDLPWSRTAARVDPVILAARSLQKARPSA